jgi:hypothetical protein
MDNYNNRMYQDKYIRNLIGKIAFGIIVFIVSLMWVIVAIGVISGHIVAMIYGAWIGV